MRWRGVSRRHGVQAFCRTDTFSDAPEPELCLEVEVKSEGSFESEPVSLG